MRVFLTDFSDAPGSASDLKRSGALLLTKLTILISIFAIYPLTTFADEFALGEAAAKERNGQKALKHFLPLAVEGHLKSQIYAAFIYENSHHYGVPSDKRAALNWWRASAEQGHAMSQLELAQTLHWGDEQGIKNIREAAKWYKLAADQGVARAQEALGFLYLTGRGVPVNKVEARRLFLLAAEQGDAEAMYKLGNMYRPLSGYALPKRYTDSGDDLGWIYSDMWYNLSGSMGKESTSELSRNLRKSQQKLLSPREIRLAEELAKDCYEKEFKNCETL